MIVEIPFDPRPLQFDVLKSLKRWNVLVCHRRFGKTVLCINKLIASALRSKKERPRFAYIAPYFRQSKLIAWDYLKHYTSVIPGVKYNEAELRCDLPNGARITLYGADNYDALRGIYLDGVVLDEFAQMNPKAWTEVIRPALSDREGWAIFIGTPKGHNAFHDVYHRATNDPEWYAALFKASDTHILPEYELQAARKDMSKDEYEQEYECSFEAAIGGAVYGDQMRQARESNRICGVAWEPDLPVHTAWDLGYDDSTAIVFYQTIGKEIRIIDYEEHFKAKPEFYATLLSEKPYKYGTHYFPHDADVKRLEAGGVSLKEQFYSLGLTNSVIVPRLDRIDGISRVRSLFSRFWIDNSNPRTLQLIECLTQYHYEYDEERKIYAKDPEHDWSSHACFTGDTKVLTRYGTQQIMDLPVFGHILTPCGWKPYQNPRITRRNAPLVAVVFSDGTTVRCTPDHLFLTVKGWRSAKSLKKGTQIQSTLTHSHNISTAASTAFGRVRDTILAVARNFTATCGVWRMEKSLMDVISTIKTGILAIMRYPILNVFLQVSTFHALGRRIQIFTEVSLPSPEPKLPNGIGRKRGDFGIVGTPRGNGHGRYGKERKLNANGVRRNSWHWLGRGEQIRDSAHLTAKPLFIDNVEELDDREDVWCLTVPEEHVFSLANGAVVHNCDAIRYMAVSFVDEIPEEEEDNNHFTAFGGPLG